jgi:hypothetical protein
MRISRSGSGYAVSRGRSYESEGSPNWRLFGWSCDCPVPVTSVIVPGPIDFPQFFGIDERSGIVERSLAVTVSCLVEAFEVMVFEPSIALEGNKPSW